MNENNRFENLESLPNQCSFDSFIQFPLDFSKKILMHKMPASSLAMLYFRYLKNFYDQLS